MSTKITKATISLYAILFATALLVAGYMLHSVSTDRAQYYPLSCEQTLLLNNITRMVENSLKINGLNATINIYKTHTDHYEETDTLRLLSGSASFKMSYDGFVRSYPFHYNVIAGGVTDPKMNLFVDLGTAYKKIARDMVKDKKKAIDNDPL